MGNTQSVQMESAAARATTRAARAANAAVVDGAAAAAAQIPEQTSTQAADAVSSCMSQTWHAKRGRGKAYVKPLGATYDQLLQRTVSTQDPAAHGATPTHRYVVCRMLKPVDVAA